MRISELKEKLEEFNVYVECSADEVGEADEYIFTQKTGPIVHFAEISAGRSGELHTYPEFFHGGLIPAKLLAIIAEFAATPLDQREENKRYLLPLEGTMFQLGELGNYSDRKSFVLFDKINNRWGGGQLDVDQYELPKFHDADFEFTQAELDFAPEWVKAITPIEIEHD